MIPIERKIITKLLHVMRDQGWEVNNVHDGEERLTCSTDEDVIDAIESVDESTINFKKGEDLNRCVVIILGNDGYDCIVDHSYPSDEDEFVKIMDDIIYPYCESLENEDG